MVKRRRCGAGDTRLILAKEVAATLRVLSLDQVTADHKRLRTSRMRRGANQ